MGPWTEASILLLEAGNGQDLPEMDGSQARPLSSRWGWEKARLGRFQFLLFAGCSACTAHCSSVLTASGCGKFTTAWTNLIWCTSRDAAGQGLAKN